ncbi:MAG: LPS-assembly protein LptD [bacterium]|nr:MAG: LPS-assembly protein LptD [bacterium]
MKIPLAQFLIILLGLSILRTVQAQEEYSTAVDTTRESIAADSIQKKKSDIEGPVKYTAENISFSVDGKKSYLRRNVRIEYQSMQLEAGEVFIDWENNFMRATGIVDSTDSLGNSIYSQLPVFQEGGNQPIHGIELEYNFKTQRGKVRRGRTEMPPGYYEGEAIKKLGQKTLLVKDGYFTSCDSIEDPHFYYKSYQMRIITGKRAMAKPIIMYIADVPILAIPFGVFPMERGRRSGLIIPKFSNSSYGGNSLRDFGYYWAASDYWDATLLMNFFERTGVTYEGELRYNKRYKFNGNVNAKYAPKDVTTGQKVQRWSVDFAHSHILNETTNFNARGSFVSDQQFLQQYSHNQNDRLNQVLTTDATFSKRWPSSKNSFNASVSRTENLQSGNIDYTLPRLSFSHTQSNIFNFDAKKSVKRKWYHDITYAYNSNFVSSGYKRVEERDSVEIIRRDQSYGWQHRAGLAFNSKILKYFKYNQNIQFEELWVPRYLDYSFDEATNSVVADTINEFRARHTFNMNLGASTTIYGLFELPLIPLQSIRHKMDPNISFTFSPDFTKSGYGYVQTFTDTLGRPTRPYDRFAANAFGGTPTSDSRRMNISVANLFQGKMIRDGEEKKIDLFNLNFGTSHNFIADSLKWSNLNTSMRASASKDLDFSVSANHSFYKPTGSGRGNRNEYVWSDGFALPRLLNVQMNARFHLAPPPPDQEKSAQPDTTLQSDSDSLEIVDNTTDAITEGLKKFNLPWDLTTNFTYSIDKNDVNNTRKRFDMNVAARLEITRNWRIQYSASINLKDKILNYQSFNIYRDLHCWEMSFAWGPNPQGYSFFTFEIHIKEPALRDIKMTKSSGGRRVF